MKKKRTWLQAVGLSIIASLLVVSVALAAYTAEILLVNTSNTSYAMTAGNVTANIDYMADNGLINADGTDTRVSIGTTAQPHMLAEDRVCFAIPSANNSSTTLSFSTGSANLTDFYIITGYSGNITVTDDSVIEPGDNFTISKSGWIDTDNVTGINLVNKEGAIRSYVSSVVADNVTSEIVTVQRLPIYTEVDAGGKLTVTLTTATGEDVDRDEDVYIYRDFGANHFDALDIDFEVYIASTSAADGYGAIGLADVINDVSGFGATDFSIGAYYTGAAYNITLYRGAGVASDTYVGAADTPYYCTLARAAGNDAVTCRIYTNETRTTLVDTLSVAGFGAAQWQYCYGFVNWNTGAGGDDFDGYTRNVDLQGGTVTSVTATGVSSGERTITTYLGSPAFPEYHALDFDFGDTNSNVNCGAIYSNIPKFWVSIRFKSDTNITAAITDNIYLWSKRIRSNDRIQVWFQNGEGRLYFLCRTGGVIGANINTTQTSWNAGQWYHVLASISDTGGGAQRLIVDNGTPVTGALATVNTPNGADFLIGKYISDVTLGFDGIISNVTVGTDDLIPTEEAQLYYGIPPGDETDLWRMDEGSGTTITSYGSAANPGTDGTATAWVTTDRPLQMAIAIDGITEDVLYGIDINTIDNLANWFLLQDNVMPYTDNITIDIGGTRQLLFDPTTYIRGTTLPDRAGTSNDGTIIWGNSWAPGITVTLGELVSDHSTTYVTATGTQDITPVVTTPTIATDAAKLAAISSDPFYLVAESIETATNNRIPILLTYWWAYIAISILLFAIIYAKFPNLIIAGLAFCLPIGYGISQGIFDFWVIAALVMWLIGCVIMEGRRSPV